MVKKVLFLVTMSVGMLFPSIAQNVPSYVPTNGLVGWWPFNGNANDESGNGNHGTVNGATLTVDRNAIENSAYSFDGSSNIKISNNNNLNNLINNFSISFWFSISKFYTNPGGGDWAAFFCKSTTSENPLYRLEYENKTKKFDLMFNGKQFFIYYSKGIIVDQFYNIQIIIENNMIKFYINNEQLLIDSTTNYSNYRINMDLLLGQDPAGVNEYLFGKLDDIAIYNRALTEEEITALYTSTPPCKNSIITITPEGNTNFCQGGFVNLNASTGINYTYQWYNNGRIINGATASTYQANTAGNYTVKVMDGTCSTTSSATTVVVNQYPSSNVQISGNTTICEGSTVTLTAQGFGSYLWSNGSTSHSIKVNQTGSYNVAVTQNGCTSNSSSTSITVNPNPTASITPQGNTTFCQGGFVNLIANGGTSYQWNTGSSNSTISANQSGTYTVNVFNSFGCQATASQPVTVNTNPNVSFQWLNQFTLKNESPIQLVGSPSGGTFIGEGVQGSTFTPANVALGKKKITYNYTSPQGCSGSSTRSTFVVDSIGNVCSVMTYDTILKLKFKLTTGINANQMTSMTLYPNPTTDVLNIEIGDAKVLDGYRYRILDAVGKEVYNQLVKNPITEIPLKSLGTTGMYLFEVIDQQSKTIQSNKIVLE
jgi:hypothetical protein